MSTRVFLAGPEALMIAARASCPADRKLTTATDGAALFRDFAVALRANEPPALVVLELSLAKISGEALVRAIRALERAFSATPTAVLLYAERAADDSLKAFLAEVGQTVHLQRPTQASAADQAARLHKASTSLLGRLAAGGR